MVSKSWRNDGQSIVCAPRRGIGQDGNVRFADLIQARQAGADLGHLHQADGAFHHPRTAGARDNDKRRFLGDAAVDRARDLLTDHSPHAAADEIKLHRTYEQRFAFQQSFTGKHRILHPGGFFGFLQPLAIGFGVFKSQGVSGRQPRIVLGEAAFIEEHLQPRAGSHFEMEIALGATLEMSLQLLFPNDLFAAVALDPQALRLDALFLRGLQRFFFFAKPSHKIESLIHWVIESLKSGRTSRTVWFSTSSPV